MLNAAFSKLPPLCLLFASFAFYLFTHLQYHYLEQKPLLYLPCLMICNLDHVSLVSA